jgi:hypothetical protein
MLVGGGEENAAVLEFETSSYRPRESAGEQLNRIIHRLERFLVA